MDNAKPQFPFFLDLPSELRMKIWRLHCPNIDPTTTPVLGVTIAPIPSNTACQTVYATPQLEEYHESILAFALIHHETRDIVIKLLPDMLDVRNSGDGLPSRVRFRRNRDIIFFRSFAPLIDGQAEITSAQYELQNVAEVAENVAVNRPAALKLDHRCLLVLQWEAKSMSPRQVTSPHYTTFSCEI